MAENEQKPEDLEVAEVGELEEGDLEDVSGGQLQELQDNTNCGNTQCCG